MWTLERDKAIEERSRVEKKEPFVNLGRKCGVDRKY
jgi:hypothetical protein